MNNDTLNSSTLAAWEASDRTGRPLAALIVGASEQEARQMIDSLEDVAHPLIGERMDGREALQAALVRRDGAVVICLHREPERAGFSTIEVVQRLAPDVPVIVISSISGEDVAVAAMRAGAADYLRSDCLSRLVAAVESCLQQTKKRHEQRAAEQQLQVLRHAVEQSPAALVITDMAGKIQYVNPRFTHLTGYPLEMVRGENPRVLKSGQTSPDEYSRLWNTISAGGRWQGCFANRRRDGQLYWEAAAISPVYDGSGRMTHFVKVAEDITRRRQAEEALKKLDVQLRRAQKMEALGELAGGIAHDFNSYLGAIIMNVELARATPDEPEQWNEYLDRTLLAGRQAAGLVRQILAYSSRRQQQQSLLQLGPIVRETLRLLDSSRPEGVRLETDIPPAIPEVRAHVAQVQQVIVNLWTNACHALNRSPGTITVTLRTVQVDRQMADRLKSLQPGCYVQLSFHDDGCGISAANQEQLFDAFFTTKPEGKGTGLGLSVVRSIMAEHHGAVVVESHPGEGTSMRLYFPAEQDQPCEPDEPARIARGSQPRILLVDDQEMMREAIDALLVHLGYQVTATEGSEQALDAVLSASEPFDLVLTDLSLGETSGAELARRLRAMRPQLPIVLTTGYDVSGVRPYLEELGIQQVLMKPFTQASLARAIAKALRGNGPGA